MDKTRIEAEQMLLTGYTVENSSISSGGKVINTSDVGVAGTRFNGAPGIYNLIVASHDENDGVSPMTVRIDGQDVYSWTLNDKSNSPIATSQNLARRVIRVTLQQNALIEIIGRHNQNEFARIDYIELEPIDTSSSEPESANPSDSGDSSNRDGANAAAVPVSESVSSTMGVGRIEAERMSLNGYSAENSSVSSGGQVIKTEDVGVAAVRFNGSAGTYNVIVASHDENDGLSVMNLRVDGQDVYRWGLDDRSNSPIATTENLARRVIPVTLNENSIIEVIGRHNQNEFARIDYVEIQPSGTSTVTPAETPSDSGENGDSGIVPSVNVTSRIAGLGRIEAEKMSLAGYTPENSSISSNGQVINTQNIGVAATRFTGESGTYNLIVGAHDENDGVSVMTIRVDGQEIYRWGLDDRTNSTIATSENLVRRVISSVKLNQNSVIEIIGRHNQNEFARVDYLEIAQEGATAAPTVVNESGNKLRVLALGDSNTRGEGTLGGYRTKFWQRARAAGVAIDMVGPRSSGPSTLGDKDHFGRGGWSIPQMTSWVRAGNLARENPDIVMFMMGTNDANTNGNVSGRAIRDRLSTFIDVAVQAAPRATFFISTIMPLDTPRGTAAEAKAARDFNNLIPALIREKAAEGKKVIFANAGGSLNVGDVNGDNSRTDDRNDGLHATKAGYDKLGDAWYNAVSRSVVWKNAAAAQKRSGSVQSDAVTDPLTGDSGDNYISGGSGFDLLTGAGGADTFTYVKPADGLDTITDFSSNDTIRVLKSGFGGDLVAGRALDSNDFVLGGNPSAKDGGSTFLFNTSENILSFDADGTGSGAAEGIAKLSNGFTLQASQIEVVA
ncbi:MAG: SGNH/GDSL hydrolase family protein [Cyanobacteria bacterium P01_F01_bin.53]